MTLLVLRISLRCAAAAVHGGHSLTASCRTPMSISSPQHVAPPRIYHFLERLTLQSDCTAYALVLSVTCSDDARRKWLHHNLKALQKTLKKAKQFEVRKIIRRIAESREGKAPGNLEAAILGSAAKSGSKAASKAADLTKLEQQLEAAKHADVERLADVAAVKAGFVLGEEQGAAPEPAAAPAGSLQVGGSTRCLLLVTFTLQMPVGLVRFVGFMPPRRVRLKLPDGFQSALLSNFTWIPRLPPPRRPSSSSGC